MKASLLPLPRFLHEPCYVRHFLAFILDREPCIADFLTASTPRASFTLFHQCAIEIAFHPHLDWQSKERLNQHMCQYIRNWPIKVRQQLTADIAALLESLLIFAGHGHDQSQNDDISASELVVWFHDELIDALVGLDHRTIDELSQDPVASASRLPLASSGLNTSYLDFYRIFRQWGSQKNWSWCDIGCGMGRSLLLAAICFPHIKPIGIDCNRARLNALRRSMMSLGLARIDIIEQDLSHSDWSLPVANCYFFYLSAGHAFDCVMDQLSHRCQSDSSPFRIVAIESHGDILPILGQCFPWLQACPASLRVSSPRPSPYILSWRSKPSKTPNACHWSDSKTPHPSLVRKLLKNAEELKNWVAIFRDKHTIAAVSLDGASLVGLNGELVLQTLRSSKTLYFTQNGPLCLLAIEKISEQVAPLLQKAFALLASGHACEVLDVERNQWLKIGHLEKVRLKPIAAVEGSQSGFVALELIRDIQMVAAQPELTRNKAMQLNRSSPQSSAFMGGAKVSRQALAAATTALLTQPSTNMTPPK